MPVKIRKARETAGAKRPQDSPHGVPARRTPRHPLLTLRQEIDNLFDTFFSGFSLGPFGRHAFGVEPFARLESVFAPEGVMMPSVDIAESDTEYRISAELSGMDEKDIEVTLSDDMLDIKGEKTEEKDEKRKDFHLTERRFGSFHRRFRIPESVDPDKVAATFEKGVLNITMPKVAEAAKPVRRVEIKGT